MPICEYCGDDFPKGGAHATHVRHCDERTATTTDVNQSSTEARERDVDDIRAEVERLREENAELRERIDMTPEEFEEHHTAAYEVGLQDGRREATTSNGNRTRVTACPDCDSEDYYAAAEVLQAREFSSEETSLLQNNTRVCADCREVYS